MTNWYLALATVNSEPAEELLVVDGTLAIVAGFDTWEIAPAPDTNRPFQDGLFLLGLPSELAPGHYHFCHAVGGDSYEITLEVD